MTTIKPPADPQNPTETGAAGAADTLDGQSTTTAETGSAADVAAFDALAEALADAQGPAGAAGAAGAQAAAAAGAGQLDALVGQVQDGTLSVDGAIDQLVERTLSDMGGQLDAAGRSELEGVLREALQSDPTLLALRAAAQRT